MARGLQEKSAVSRLRGTGSLKTEEGPARAGRPVKQSLIARKSSETSPLHLVDLEMKTSHESADRNGFLGQGNSGHHKPNNEGALIEGRKL